MRHLECAVVVYNFRTKDSGFANVRAVNPDLSSSRNEVFCSSVLRKETEEEVPIKLP